MIYIYSNITCLRFSFHEMAVFDLPTMMRRILEVTKRKSLAYIGHSMGTTIFLAMSSQTPLIAKMVSVSSAVLLAPVVDPTGIRNPLIQTLTKEILQDSNECR